MLPFSTGITSIIFAMFLPSRNSYEALTLAPR